MSQLKTLQNSPFANLRVSDDVPRSLKNDYEAIIITSSKLIKESTLKIIKNSNIKVWSAMENNFLNA